MSFENQSKACSFFFPVKTRPKKVQIVFSQHWEIFWASLLVELCFTFYFEKKERIYFSNKRSVRLYSNRWWDLERTDYGSSGSTKRLPWKVMKYLKDHFLKTFLNKNMSFPELFYVHQANILPKASKASFMYIQYETRYNSQS